MWSFEWISNQIRNQNRKSKKVQLKPTIPIRNPSARKVTMMQTLSRQMAKEKKTAKNLRRHRSELNMIAQSRVSVPGPVSGFGVNTDSNGESGTPSNVTLISAAAAEKDLTRLITNPFSDGLVARFPDPNTLLVTTTVKSVYHKNMQIWNGTGGVNDGSTGFYYRGDTTGCYGEPSSIASSTASPTPYAITWQGPTVNLRDGMVSGAYARPVSMGLRLTYSGVGPYHSVVIRVMEIPPWGPISSVFPNFPAAANQGPTYYQKEFFRAREVTLNPGESIEMISLPLDSRCISFADAFATRDQMVPPMTNAVCMSWSGYIGWVFGLSSLDALYVDIVHHYEFYYPLPTTTTTYVPNRAIVLPSAAARDAVITKAVKASASGWTVFKSIVGTIGTVASMVAPFMMNGGPAPTPSQVELPEAFQQFSERVKAEGRGGGQYLRRDIVAPYSPSALWPTVAVCGAFMPRDATFAIHFPNAPQDDPISGNVADELKEKEERTFAVKRFLARSAFDSQSSSSSSGDGRNLDLPLSGRGMAQVAPTVRKQ